MRHGRILIPTEPPPIQDAEDLANNLINSIVIAAAALQALRSKDPEATADMLCSLNKHTHRRQTMATTPRSTANADSPIQRHD